MSTDIQSYQLTRDATYSPVEILAYLERNITPIDFQELQKKEEEELKTQVTSWSTLPTRTLPGENLKSENPEINRTVNIITPSEQETSEKELSSITFRKIKRKPILDSVLSYANAFASTVGTLESAKNYSLLKERIKELWKYAGADEYFTMILTSLDSVTRFNLWRNFSERQTKELINTIKLLVEKDTITINDARNITINLSKVRLNLFPYEKFKEEKERQAN